MGGLGWDPTVDRIDFGTKTRHKFTVGNEVLPQRHLPSTGDVPDSGRLSTLLPTQLGNVPQAERDIPRRAHMRTVFHDVGVALQDVTHLPTFLRCLRDALKGEVVPITPKPSIAHASISPTSFAQGRMGTS